MEVEYAYATWGEALLEMPMYMLDGILTFLYDSERAKLSGACLKHIETSKCLDSRLVIQKVPPVG